MKICQLQFLRPPKPLEALASSPSAAEAAACHFSIVSETLSATAAILPLLLCSSCRMAEHSTQLHGCCTMPALQPQSAAVG
jgi:hypothetical protein